jgi:thiamine-monophosphate kinase
MKIKDVGEIALIKRLSKDFRLDPTVIVGSGDDAAVLKWKPDKYLLFKCDMVIEGVHFNLKHATPFRVGWKALARAVSDIAAMGGIPRHAVVSLAIDGSLDASVAEGVCKGLKALADRFGINIVGGDMSRSAKIFIDVSLIGEVRKKDLVLRSGARAGDLVLATGSFGGSMKGKHLDFLPRVAESAYIVRNFNVNAMIDCSDGLALDVARIARASGTGAALFEEGIPLSKDARTLEDALYDGEDYELIFTMSPKEAERLIKSNFSRAMTRVSVIGEITPKKDGYKLVTEDGVIKELNVKGYTHF